MGKGHRIMKIDDALQKVLSMLPNEGSDKKYVSEQNLNNCQRLQLGDTVELSSTIRSLAKAMSFDVVRPIRMDRVVMLKSLIESGDYNVSGRDIAEKMVAYANKSA
jgi:anti-sigma28 factor (negative regulator of flagellin synthesis)